jgi:acyl CoA:acetate/3-ketoacid CoA transferase alpha subunit
MKNQIGHTIDPKLLKRMGLEYSKEAPKKDTATLHERLEHNGKLMPSLEDAIRATGLRDGMTISFHHHFRDGDAVLNTVVATLSKMGYKDLTVASSSLSNAHAPLVEYIKDGTVTRLQSSGCRGRLADAISKGEVKLREPMIFRSHGGRAAAIANGTLHIDVAFLGVASCDALGNASGTNAEGTDMCGSLGYARVDARYADKVVLLTENLAAYPNVPCSIPATDVDYVVKVDSIGDSSKISSGATRYTKNPRDLMIAESAAKAIIASGFFGDGMSIQTGSGGAALAVTRFLEGEMTEKGITADFALGGITSQIVKMHESGLVKKVIDVQSFDGEARPLDPRQPEPCRDRRQPVRQPLQRGQRHPSARRRHPLRAGDRHRLQRQRPHRLGRHHPRRHRRPSRHRLLRGPDRDRQPADPRPHPLRRRSCRLPGHRGQRLRRAGDRRRHRRQPEQARDRGAPAQGGPQRQDHQAVARRGLCRRRQARTARSRR